MSPRTNQRGRKQLGLAVRLPTGQLGCRARLERRRDGVECALTEIPIAAHQRLQQHVVRTHLAAIRQRGCPRFTAGVLLSLAARLALIVLVAVLADVLVVLVHVRLIIAAEFVESHEIDAGVRIAIPHCLEQYIALHQATPIAEHQLSLRIRDLVKLLQHGKVHPRALAIRHRRHKTPLKHGQRRERTVVDGDGTLGERLKITPGERECRGQLHRLEGELQRRAHRAVSYLHHVRVLLRDRDGPTARPQADCTELRLRPGREHMRCAQVGQILVRRPHPHVGAGAARKALNALQLGGEASGVGVRKRARPRARQT
eukprot:m.52753 g.52753  ORF g.52753 m.52753 type:complete len:315 (-) comp6406_c0_seq2:29-973(-)